MMKENKTILQLILFTFIYAGTSLLAQPYNLQKTWVGADLEYLKVDSQKVHFEVFGSYPENINYLIKKIRYACLAITSVQEMGFQKYIPGTMIS
ncbi:hypothetical protein [Niabella hibiscisoli]|uniref:hypothetical protein n=1 Tax=Niabella hibiscisoli TaxID=1825928 RepID=UPI001F0E6A95|nr:hypothetical protein [Niabella hibiscisoli]MCH5717606.1 hypothetical protein [Niabella hibiscisoli]